MMTKNVKIITIDGAVIMAVPVKTQKEKAAIERRNYMSKSIVGSQSSQAKWKLPLKICRTVRPGRIDPSHPGQIDLHFYADVLRI
jgi:hypothetical protein